MASLKKEFKYLSKSLIIYFIVFCMVFNLPLSVLMAATPVDGDVVANMITNGNVIAGTAEFDLVNSTVNMATIDGTIINYDQFDIDAGWTVNFNQPSAASAVLNRVVTANPSDIMGNLNSNGRVFLINSAGILVGPNATINVNQLVASGLDILDDDFINGIYQFDEVMNSAADVVNEGTIITDMGAALIGRMVKNAGSISAGSNGLIVMAAGDSILLREPSSEIIIQIGDNDPPDPLVEVTSVSEGAAQTDDFSPGDVVNEGDITTDGGCIILAAGDTMAAVLQDLDFLSVPIIEATRGTGRVIQSGHLHADATVGRGGLINITAPDLVRLTGTSLTTANAGGAVGNGGVILARSEDLTEYLAGATIEARSGSNSVDGGEGGVVDLSGDHVLFEGDVLGGDIDILGSEFVTVEIPDKDPVIGTNPNRGVFIIDPVTLTVKAGEKPVDPPTDVIYEADIEAFSEVGVDVVLTADFNLTVEKLRSGESGDLGLEGGIGDLVFRNAFDAGSITFDTGDLISTDNGGNVFILAGDGRDNGGVGLVVGDISTYTAANDKITDPGKIRLLTVRPEESDDGGDMFTGSLTVDGGSFVEISAISAGNLTVVGDVISMTNQVPAEDQTIGEARICLVANEVVDVTADKIIVEAHGKKTTNAEIVICAGEEVNISGVNEISSLAKTSENQEGSTAESLVAISSGWKVEGFDGTIMINGLEFGVADNSEFDFISSTAQVSGAGTPAKVDAGDLDVDGNAQEDTGGDEGHAEINIDDEAEIGPDPDDEVETPCDDCPVPPVLPPQPTPNLPPTADPGFHIVHMNTPIVDTAADLVDDPDIGDDLNFTEVTDQATTLGGTVTVNEDGTYSYTPPTNATGDDSFTYEVSDGENQVQGMVNITLTNTAPNTNPDNDTTHMNTGVVYQGSVLDNDSDSDPDPFSIVSHTEPTNGSLVFNETTGEFEYTPNTGFTGNDSFTYSITDGELIDGTTPADSVMATVTIAVTNAAPTPVDDNANTHMNTTVGGNVLNTTNPDTDPDGDAFNIIGHTNTTNGTLVFNEATGEFEYQPDAGFTGIDTFTYSVTDGELIDGTTPASPVTATVTIAIGNAAPTPTDDTASTHGETPVSGNVLNTTNPDTDPDGDPFSIVSHTEPSNGTLVFNEATGEFEYLPGTGFLGVDTFTYSVTDGEQGADAVTATVTINVGNLDPIATDDSYAIDQNTTLTISDILGILQNDFDPDGDPLIPGLVSGPTDGTFVLNQDGSFSYVPADGFFGEDSFVYLVADKFGGSSEAIVTITVNEVIPEPTPVALLPAAPLPQLVGIEVAGCPASMDAAAAEIGTTTQMLQISIAKAMSTTPNVQPCSACETLMDQAAILRDTDGRYMTAMVETFNIVAPSDVPFTPEMGASIATAFADNIGNPDSPQFATAMEFMEAFVTYVAVVDTELGAPLDDSMAYVIDKYGTELTAADNANIAEYIRSRLQAGG